MQQEETACGLQEGVVGGGGVELLEPPVALF